MPSPLRGGRGLVLRPLPDNFGSETRDKGEEANAHIFRILVEPIILPVYVKCSIRNRALRMGTEGVQGRMRW